MLYNKVIKYLTLSSFSTLLVKKKSKKSQNLMIETNKNHIPLILTFLLKESTIVRDYCEIIQNN